VPLPISRSALDHLGERLAASDDISDDDYALLGKVFGAYQAALGEVQRRLTALGYAPTTRVKTTQVLVEKLRREQGMKLKGVQDVAGARIVVNGTRRDQDEIVRLIVTAFDDERRPPKVRDRRAEPSAGYRAVHVIVHVHDVPVEIQVRTAWQDTWAQAVEALGDKWGRGIRYGKLPENPDRLAAPAPGFTRRKLWRGILQASDLIDIVEQRAAAGAAAIEQVESIDVLVEALTELADAVD
jgi:hypothetical protein